MSRETVGEQKAEKKTVFTLFYKEVSEEEEEG
jgi:hypothetical protein